MTIIKHLIVAVDEKGRLQAVRIGNTRVHVRVESSGLTSEPKILSEDSLPVRVAIMDGL